MNTSIVNFFDSLKATNQFINPGTYYSAPSRQFSFDNNFTNSTKLPPERLASACSFAPNGGFLLQITSLMQVHRIGIIAALFVTAGFANGQEQAKEPARPK